MFPNFSNTTAVMILELVTVKYRSFETSLCSAMRLSASSELLFRSTKSSSVANPCEHESETLSIGVRRNALSAQPNVRAGLRYVQAKICYTIIPNT